MHSIYSRKEECLSQMNLDSFTSDSELGQSEIGGERGGDGRRGGDEAGRMGQEGDEGIGKRPIVPLTRILHPGIPYSEARKTGIPV